MMVSSGGRPRISRAAGFGIGRKIVRSTPLPIRTMRQPSKTGAWRARPSIQRDGATITGRAAAYARRFIRQSSAVVSCASGG